jgi:Rrf2 family protein
MSGIVKFSEASSIALHTMTVLAAEADRHLTVAEIAARMPVSESHLAKVLQRLGKAGLVGSVRGPGGGFVLRGDPARVTLLQVHEAIEGPLEVGECAFPGAQACRACILDGALREANALVKDRLARTTLADLARTFRPGGELVTFGRRPPEKPTGRA